MSITVRFQYGGHFEFKEHRMLYRKGQIFNKRDVDPDLLSKIELEEFLKNEVGINDVKELWYLEARKSISNGLRQILVDKDIVSMINSVGVDKTAHVYVVQYNDLGPISFNRPPPKGPNSRRSPKKLVPRRNQQALPLEHIVTEEQFVEARVEEDIVFGSDSSSSELDCDFQDSEDEDDDIFQDNVDESVQDDLGLLVAYNDGANFEEELELEEDSENLLSLSDSDGEKKQRYPEFNAIADFKTNISLEVGMRFGSNDIFRRALRQHSIENGGDFYYLHNEKHKVSAYCKYKCDCSMQHARKKCICKKIYCGFKACARRVGEDDTFQLKTWVPKHTCCWRVENAVAKDGNDNIFPVAYAVVEAERKETWCWFLENLMQDLGDLPLTFMSDIQKGLLEALNLIVPMADTRVCVRHLYNNFKGKWPGKAFKDALWAAARSCNEVDFEEAMAHMKSLDEGAYAYLMRADPNTWARCRFKLYNKSDMLLNNVCESFNNFILPSRDKPILTMCEWIRRALMKRFMSKRSGMSSYTSSPMTPKAQKKVEYALTEAARTCRVLSGGGDRYEVDRFDKRYVVDLAQRSCGCNKWDLTGIPCQHAVACILMRRGKLENFVDKYYTKETYMKAYGQILEPIPGHKQWVKTGQTPPDPPMLIVQPGRPRKARRKEQGEEMPRKHIRVCVKYKCSHCGQEGHNKKKCNNPPKNPNFPKLSKKGGRPMNPNTIRIASNKRRIITQGQPTTSTHGQYEALIELPAPTISEVDHVGTIEHHEHPSTQFQSQQSSTAIGSTLHQTSNFSWGRRQDGSVGTPTAGTGRRMEVPKKIYNTKAP